MGDFADSARVLAAASFILLAPCYPAQADEADDARATCAQRVATDHGIDAGQVRIEFAGRSEMEDSIEVRGSFKPASGGNMTFNCLVGERGGVAGQIVEINYL
jgi:hypothetical protein